MRFRDAADAALEDEVALRLERAWNCRIHKFPPLTPLDYYAERGDEILGYPELKCRTHSVTAFGTVFLSVRKWLALQMAEHWLGAPGVFVVRWPDALRAIRIDQVETRGAVTIAGSRGNGHGRDGVEPMILVPVDQMREIVE